MGSRLFGVGLGWIVQSGACREPLLRVVLNIGIIVSGRDPGWPWVG